MTMETDCTRDGNLLRPVPDTANRSLTRAETEMLRNLDVEFRGNELPDARYSWLVRNGAVMHMKNTCSPMPQNVKIVTPRWAVEAAAGSGRPRRPRCARAPGVVEEPVRVLGHRCLKRLRRR
ncbi:hypothetical protein [Streptomyces sp. NPDC004629]|uniref:hypothetical protein n=1 Tax=Streptomyces sp. NPDC004629 TaxID=3364705 RepID=UPI00367AA8CD